LFWIVAKLHHGEPFKLHHLWVLINGAPHFSDKSPGGPHFPAAGGPHSITFIGSHFFIYSLGRPHSVSYLGAPHSLIMLSGGPHLLSQSNGGPHSSGTPHSLSKSAGGPHFSLWSDGAPHPLVIGAPHFSKSFGGPHPLFKDGAPHSLHLSLHYCGLHKIHFIGGPNSHAKILGGPHFPFGGGPHYLSQYIGGLYSSSIDAFYKIPLISMTSGIVHSDVFCSIAT
jgi:hypothetical protein